MAFDLVTVVSVTAFGVGLWLQNREARRQTQIELDKLDRQWSIRAESVERSIESTGREVEALTQTQNQLWLKLADLPADTPDEDTDESDDYLGFSNIDEAKEVLEFLGKGKFNAPCPYCKSKKTKWDLLGVTQMEVGKSEGPLILILSCPTCATVRLVDPKTLVRSSMTSKEPVKEKDTPKAT